MEPAAALKTIRDPGMRSAKMIELLSGDPEAAVIFLHRLLRDSGGPRDPQADVLDAMIIALGSTRLAYETRSQIYAAAVARGDGLVARMLLDGRRAGRAEKLEQTLGEARALVPQGRPLTLGERKSLARGKRSDDLLHLFRDPHPDVVEILLDNPHLIEADVLTIASRRPTLAATQLHILASRWRRRYRVKRALVLNPFSPTAIGIRLSACLNDQDLTLTSRDQRIDSIVREQARDLLELRRG